MPAVKPKIIVICGPTASGKSEVAIRLAKAFHLVKSPTSRGLPVAEFDRVNGEIISADSRQVYRGLNIGSGKVDGAWSMEHGTFVSEGVAHHLIDVADPMEDFNVSHFKTQAEKAIEDILERGKVPIICGGTGFWIDSLINNATLPDVKPNEELRSMLRNKSAEELFEQLKKLDPERATTIEKQNPVRLIRAIEIATALGKVPAKSSIINDRSSKYSVLQIGLSVPKEILDAKIKKRLDERFDQGMTQEVEKLHENGVTWEWLERIGLEYRWIARYLQNKISIEDMKQKLYFDIIHYAKRQMTWLKRNKNILWISDYNEIEKAVKQFLG